jgi:hypothetical protein
MAVYPTGTYSPSPVSAGQTITASRENAQDAEITAVQDGLRSGLQHALTISTGGLTVSTGSVNIGGPSSVATLQVNGTSTFTGAATFSSNVSVGGTLTITSGLDATITRRVPTCKVTHGSTQSLLNATWTGLSWNTEIEDSTGMHSTAANSSRIALNSAGVWLIGGAAAFSIGTNPSTLNMGVRILLNDTDELDGHMTAPGTNIQTDPFPLSLSVAHIATSTGDYVTLQAYQSGGVTQSVHASTRTTVFWAIKVSA